MAEKKAFPTQAADYELLEEIGHGSFAIVYHSVCKPLDQEVAVKCLDLDSCNVDLNSVSTEAQLMSLIDHPNVVRAYCSFIVDHFLWVVMPYMDGGSCLHIMKVRCPDGLEESIIAVILKETLKGLDYLHQQQQIHRDVKAGNILIDTNGAIKLGDFGTSAYMFCGGDRLRCRNTFTGTPCWMAPEVMEQKQGYDWRVDMWSFGITALELAHGHAPFSKYPPMKVLMMTITNAAPCLDHEKDKRFSKAFREVIRLCVNKDPSKRPTTKKLLKHPFFKNTKHHGAIVEKLLNGLGPLWERERILKEKDAALLALKKPAFLQEEVRSRDEYVRGVSCWNFDIESLKGQAALLPDEDDQNTADEDSVLEDNPGLEGEDLSKNISQAKSTRQGLTLNTNQIGQKAWLAEKEPKKFGRFGVFEGELELESPGWHDLVKPKDGGDKVSKLTTIAEDKGRNDFEEKGLQDLAASTHMLAVDGLCESNICERESENDGISYFAEEKGAMERSEEQQEGALLVMKSCPAVISTDKGPMQMQSPSCSDGLSIPASLVVQQLKSLLLQTVKQYETLLDLLKIASPEEAINVPGGYIGGTKADAGGGEPLEAMRSLEQQIHDLQSKVANLTKELAWMKSKNTQLERQLNAIHNKQEEERIREEEADKEYLLEGEMLF